MAAYTIKLTDEQVKIIKVAAALRGLTLSTYLGQAAAREAERDASEWARNKRTPKA